MTLPFCFRTKNSDCYGIKSKEAISMGNFIKNLFQSFVTAVAIVVGYLFGVWLWERTLKGGVEKLRSKFKK